MIPDVSPRNLPLSHPRRAEESKITEITEITQTRLDLTATHALAGGSGKFQNDAARREFVLILSSLPIPTIGDAPHVGRRIISIGGEADVAYDPHAPPTVRISSNVTSQPDARRESRATICVQIRGDASLAIRCLIHRIITSLCIPSDCTT